MTACNRIFTVVCNGQAERYWRVVAYSWTTHEMVWASEKCWVSPGTEVAITDDQGRTKIFVKEKGET